MTVINCGLTRDCSWWWNSLSSVLRSVGMMQPNILRIMVMQTSHTIVTLSGIELHGFAAPSASLMLALKVRVIDLSGSTNTVPNPLTWLGCFTDWIAVFMQRARHVDPTTSSLATSMYWIGMASGRFILGPISQYIGVRIAVAGYIIALMILQVLFRFLRSVTASLLLLAGSGLFCGPMFPSAILLLSSKLSQRAQVGAVAAVSALGQVGAGIAPFAVGLIADNLGIKHLLSVILGLAASALLVWTVFARLPKATSELARQGPDESKRTSI